MFAPESVEIGLNLDHALLGGGFTGECGDS